MKESKYYPEAKLMMECLPFLVEFSEFALKGGTALNFFIRNMPRLSVDIDLTYLPLQDREASLQNISDLLGKISKSLQRGLPGVKVNESYQRGQKRISKLFVNRGNVQVKIEPNEVIRGSVFKPNTLTVTDTVQEFFEMEVDIQVLSFEDLYGGKICAALDRQHPRDLFDVMLLFENEGLTTQLRQSFLVYLLSHDRPINEVIAPTIKDIFLTYESEFKGMTSEEIPFKALLESRERLISEIHESLTDEEKAFVLSFKNAEPDWSLFPLKIESLPAIRWKLQNIRALKEKNPDKHAKLYEILKAKLSRSE